MSLRHSLMAGGSFGLTSAIITTLGLMVGLHSGTQSRIAVLGGILTIAVADAFSDALGIHISEESENVHTLTQVWTATAATFLTKFLFTLTFAVPVIFAPLSLAIVISLAWGFVLLAVLSYGMARSQRKPVWQIAGEHMLIALVVIGLTHLIGDWVSTLTK